MVRGEGTLVHGEERVGVRSGDFVSYHAGYPEAHTLENTGQGVLEVWAFGDRVPHEVCVYPDEQVAYVEALGGDVPLGDVEAWATLAGRGNGIEAAGRRRARGLERTLRARSERRGVRLCYAARTREPAPSSRSSSLAKRYRDVIALDGVSLTIGAGEIFALLGPNGAGKTTLIGAVCGLVKKTAGHDQLFGMDLDEDPVTPRYDVGLVPQEINFDPFFTVRESLRDSARLLRPAAGRGPHRRGARGAQAHREGRRPDARAVGRHEAAAAHRQGAGAPAEAGVPRRAHRRRRRRAAPRPVDLRAQAASRGHDGGAHHALPRGGRGARRPRRHHRQGQAAARRGEGGADAAPGREASCEVRFASARSAPLPAGLDGTACSPTDRCSLAFTERDGTPTCGEVLAGAVRRGAADRRRRDAAAGSRTCCSSSRKAAR